MTLDFYYFPGSPPCSAVQMTAKAVGVKLNLKLVDLFKGEHVAPEFVKINPQHVLPTLVVDNVSLWESRAIIVYLVERYGKDGTLYPNDPLKRALVNQRLYFDLGTLYQRLMDNYYPKLFPAYKDRVIPNAEQNLTDAVGFLNTFLEDQKYVAGDTFTVADISLFASTSVLKACGFDLTPFNNVVSWFEHVTTIIPGYDINQGHVEAFKNFFPK